MKKHIGRITNTGARVVVVYMQIPGSEDHALVVPTDSLTPRMEQAVMEILESKEGQAERDLCRVLERRSIPETGRSVAQGLHDVQALHRVPVSNITMMPMPNMPFPLEKILEQMPGAAPRVTTAPAQSVAEVFAPAQPTTPEMLAESRANAEAFANAMTANAALPAEKFNPYAGNRAADVDENSMGIARNLLIEAQMLEADALKKRERAYATAPSLRPAPVITTVYAPTVVQGGGEGGSAAPAAAPKKRGRPAKATVAK